MNPPKPSSLATIATPPEHLAPKTAAWWKRVVAEFALEEHHLRILQAACEAWDRMEQARTAIATLGLTYVDRFGAPKTRPEVKVENDSRIAFARMLRELGLDVAGPDEPPRMPRVAPGDHRRKGS